MDGTTWGIFAIIIIYLLGMVAVGLYYMKKTAQRGIIILEDVSWDRS